ncbi:hypothetical protein HWB99_gp103 [Mycobacterium phage DrLupo]|uniref:Uncharacterized protein n=1 Tax=Mycobacterium phage DrLupo TaxID=2499037 RepID=A0A3S9UQQ9_9CAUD|nr:hypothetical protein HWB99_gp103 [Mycobacterium phage DrLupo]AZS12639.1 hypothetical protein SEA_DRLUPO_103 [Mycobacterium phage DrLupo]
MRAQIFTVFKKTTVQDPQYAAQLGRDVETEGAAVEVYQFMFSTMDEEHAKFVCRNEDARYVFTSQPIWFGELA